MSNLDDKSFVRLKLYTYLAYYNCNSCCLLCYDLSICYDCILCELIMLQVGEVCTSEAPNGITRE